MGDVWGGSVVRFGWYRVDVVWDRRKVIMVLGIVMESLGMEWVGSIRRRVLFMEVIVVDEGLYAIVVDEGVILLGRVRGVWERDIG